MNREIKFREITKCSTGEFGVMFYGIGEYNHYHHKSENVVNQFTGVKDIKGVDIYEGDIVKAEYVNHRNSNDEEETDKAYLAVIFEDCQFKLDTKRYWDSKHGLLNASVHNEIRFGAYLYTNQKEDGDNYSFTMVVVGNIYENSDLLSQL